MVLGSPEYCAALMEAGQHILVFPGGGREVMRRKGEAYQLIWKQRTGFARLAIEHGYDIIPFGSVLRIRTRQLGRDASDADAVWRLRGRVAKAVEHQIAAPKAYRKIDRKKHWSVLRRWLAPVQDGD